MSGVPGFSSGGREPRFDISAEIGYQGELFCRQPPRRARARRTDPHDPVLNRAHEFAQIIADGTSSPKAQDDALAELERLAGEAERLREALAHIAAVLRGMQSDDTITQRIDLTPEITMADHAIEASLLADGTAV
jgi:hypothetical protein